MALMAYVSWIFGLAGTSGSFFLVPLLQDKLDKLAEFVAGRVWMRRWYYVVWWRIVIEGG